MTSPNVGVVRGRTGRGAAVAALVSALVTLTAVLALAIDLQGGF